MVGAPVLPSTVGGRVSLWPTPLGIELPRPVIGVVPPTLIGPIDPQDSIGTDADPARRIYTLFSEASPREVELPRLIVSVIPPTSIRTVGPQDTIGTDADPGRCTYTRFSVDLFGSFSLGRVALRVDFERCRVACARCAIVYIVYQYEVCLPSLGGNVAAQV